MHNHCCHCHSVHFDCNERWEKTTVSDAGTTNMVKKKQKEHNALSDERKSIWNTVSNVKRKRLRMTKNLSTASSTVFSFHLQLFEMDCGFGLEFFRIRIRNSRMLITTWINTVNHNSTGNFFLSKWAVDWMLIKMLIHKLTYSLLGHSTV